MNERCDYERVKLLSFDHGAAGISPPDAAPHNLRKPRMEAAPKPNQAPEPDQAEQVNKLKTTVKTQRLTLQLRAAEKRTHHVCNRKKLE